MLPLCLIIVIFSAISVPTFASNSDSSIELVHVYFRHGDRTPDEKDLYPTDPYKDISFYPMGFGQLTNKGKFKMYVLGSLLRSRYNEFLGKIYSPELLSAVSTDYDRTKMSILLVLAGLWPPAPSQEWNPILAWQPIPYDFDKSKHDYTVQRPTYYCPKYLQELKRLIDSEEVKGFVSDNRDIFQYVEKSTGKSMKIPANVFDIYQTINAQGNMNLTLPQWSKSMYPEKLHAVAGMQVKFENYNDVLIRLNGGRHMKMVIEVGQAKIKDELKPKGRKMFLISGHENNVANVLSALNLLTPHVPKYGSAVIIELRRKYDNGQYGYKVFYHNSTEYPIVLTVPGCTEFCPVEKFIHLTAKYIPGNYTAECESTIDLN